MLLTDSKVLRHDRIGQILQCTTSGIAIHLGSILPRGTYHGRDGISFDLP